MTRRIPATVGCAFVLSTAACGARRDGHAAAPAVDKATGAEPGPRCTIHGAHAEFPVVRVHWEGEAFELAVWDVPVDARPGEVGQNMDVSVLAPLEFEGSIPGWDFPTTVVAPLVERQLVMTRAAAEASQENDSRLLRLAPGTEIQQVRAHGGAVVAHARLARGVLAASLVFPCDALTGNTVPIRGAAHPGRGDGTHWRARHGELEVFSVPRIEPAPLRILVEPSARNWFPLARTHSRGDFTHVVWQGQNSSSLAGWVRTSDLESARPESPPDSTSGFIPDLVDCEPRAAEAGVHREFVEIVPGTQVHGTPGGSVWATVPSGGTPRHVRRRDGEAWAAIVSLHPQIAGAGWKYDCEEFERAWVPARALRNTSVAAPEASTAALGGADEHRSDRAPRP